MKHPLEVTRAFSKTDEEMLQQADVKLSLFKENINLFSERFPQLADPFATEWAATIATGRGMLPDYAALASQSNQTDTLETLMDGGRVLFQSLVLYTKIAFPDNASVLRLIGQPQYVEAHQSQLKLPMLLHSAFIQASLPEHKSALVAKGMKESEIASLETMADSITMQDLAQEKSKKDRSLSSNERIVAMNAVWEKMALVCQCAKLVFQNNATLYAMFLLDDGKSATAADKAAITPPIQTN